MKAESKEDLYRRYGLVEPREDESQRARRAWAIGVGCLLSPIVLIISGLGLLFFLSSTFLCQNDVIQEVYSPDRRHKAIVYERNCGATTGWSTQISVIDGADSLPRRSGNVYKADGYPDWFAIRLSWEDNDSLVIEHNGKPLPIQARDRIGGIRVRYVENRTDIMPPRPFMPNELLLPVSFFPKSWTSLEERPLGPEVIKGSKENNPYVNFTPPPPAEYPAAHHSVSRYDNVEAAEEYYDWAIEGLRNRYSTNCVSPAEEAADDLIFASSFTNNYFIGYRESYEDGSGGPNCELLAQYEEFIISFTAKVSDSGLTPQQFNELARVIDQIMIDHLQGE